MFSDDDDEIVFNELFIKLTQKFKAIRVMDNNLIPTSWVLETEVIYGNVNIDEVDDEEYEFNIRAALTKIQFWFSQFVDGSIIVNRDNEWSSQTLFTPEGSPNISNNIIVLPGDPTDAMLAEVFQSKLNALSGGFITFGVVELKSDDPSNLSFMYVGDSNETLPSMDDWTGPNNWFDEPWWARNDASTFDAIPAEDADLSDIPQFASSLDFIVDALRPKNKNVTNIIKPKFNPSVIDGGLSDKDDDKK